MILQNTYTLRVAYADTDQMGYVYYGQYARFFELARTELSVSYTHLDVYKRQLLRTELLPAFEMSEAKLDYFIARIRARRPSMLFGYPSALSFMCKHARKRGQRMRCV